MQPAIGVSAVSSAGVHTRQQAAALASSGERLLGQAPAGKSVLEVAGGADDVFLVGGHELRAVEPQDGDDGIADGVAAAETCGTSGRTPASEAAIAWKSASFNGPLGGDEGSCGPPGIDRALGKAGIENISRG